MRESSTERPLQWSSVRVQVKAMLRGVTLRQSETSLACLLIWTESERNANEHSCSEYRE